MVAETPAAVETEDAVIETSAGEAPIVQSCWRRTGVNQDLAAQSI